MQSVSISIPPALDYLPLSSSQPPSPPSVPHPAMHSRTRRACVPVSRLTQLPARARSITTPPPPNTAFFAAVPHLSAPLSLISLSLAVHLLFLRRFLASFSRLPVSCIALSHATTHARTHAPSRTVSRSSIGTLGSRVYPTPTLLRVHPHRRNQIISAVVALDPGH